jgi:hypothetical protein
LGSTLPEELKGTNGASAPFWAPKGDRIGFFADGALKTIDLRSTDVTIVADAPASRGGAWGAHDVIVFAPSERGGLSKISALGGAPAPITALDAATGQVSHRWPSFLPDGERFVFSAWESEGQAQTVYVGSTQSAGMRRVGDHMNNATFANGFLVYLREGRLFARPFDLRRQLALGTERMAMNPVAFSAELARGAFSIHGRTLVYAPTTSRAQFRAVTPVGRWRNRSGSPAAVHLDAPPAALPSPGLGRSGELEPSPDERWVAYTSLVSGVPQVFVRPSSPAGKAVQVTIEGGLHPHWRSDGHELFFVTGNRYIGVAAVDSVAGVQAGAAQRLFAVDFAPDDQGFVFTDFAVSKDGGHVFVREILGQPPSAPLLIVDDWRSRLGAP